MNDSEGVRENGKKPKAKNRNQAAQQQKTHHIIVQWSAIFACVSPSSHSGFSGCAALIIISLAWSGSRQQAPQKATKA